MKRALLALLTIACVSCNSNSSTPKDAAKTDSDIKSSQKLKRTINYSGTFSSDAKTGNPCDITVTIFQTGAILTYSVSGSVNASGTAIAYEQNDSASLIFKGWTTSSGKNVTGLSEESMISIANYGSENPNGDTQVTSCLAQNIYLNSKESTCTLLR